MVGIGDRLRFIIDLERERITSRGLLYNLIGWGTLACVFTLIPWGVKSIWPEHIENPFLFYMIISTFLISLSTPLYFLIYLPAYLKWTNCYESFRINPTLSKPWERPDWPEVRMKWAKTLFINKFIVNPCFLLLMMALSRLLNIGYRCDRESFPQTSELVSQIICVMLIDDFFYMLIHRVFHEIPALYKFHKVHHEYDSPFSMIGEYAHPVEQVLANILPVTISFTIIKSHMFVVFFWLCYKSYNSSEGHSGYAFPWSFTRVVPFMYSPIYHDFHHSANVGNYATSLYLFETLAGSNDVFFSEEFKHGRIKTQLKSKCD